MKPPPSPVSKLHASCISLRSAMRPLMRTMPLRAAVVGLGLLFTSCERKESPNEPSNDPAKQAETDKAMAAALEQLQPDVSAPAPPEPSPGAQRAKTPTEPPTLTVASVRDAHYPSDYLLKQQRAVLSLILLERYPWLANEMQSAALFASIAARKTPSWQEVLSSQAEGGSCRWKISKLPPESPLYAYEEQVSCLIPQGPATASSGPSTSEENELKEGKAAEDEQAQAQQADRPRGISCDFTVRLSDGQITLMSVGSELIDSPLTRDRLLARLLLSWQLKTDPNWTERASALEESYLIEQQKRAAQDNQLEPLLKAIGAWMDENAGRRPVKLDQLGPAGFLVSKNLLLWHSPEGPSEPIVYFPKPLLIHELGKALILAAPRPNPDGTRTVGSSSLEALNIDNALFEQSLKQAER